MSEKAIAFMHEGKYGRHYFNSKADAERSAKLYGDANVISLYAHPATVVDISIKTRKKS